MHIRVYTVLLLALLCTIQGFAQNNQSMTRVSFGGISTSAPVTKEKMMSVKSVDCDQPGCKVISYTYMILPKGKDIIGPYRVEGRDVPEKFKSIIKDLPDTRTRIFIDSIKVLCNGQQAYAQALSLQCGQ